MGYQSFLLKVFFCFFIIFLLFHIISKIIITEKYVKNYREESIEIEVKNLTKIKEVSYYNYLNSSLKTMYQDKTTGIYYLDCYFEQKKYAHFPDECLPTPIKNNEPTTLLVNEKELLKKGTIDDPIIFLDNYPFLSKSDIQKCYDIYAFNVKQYIKYSILGKSCLSKEIYNTILYTLIFFIFIIIIISIKAILNKQAN